jgi:hypothetical protein
MQSEPPANGQYLVAAYIVTAVILLGYAGVLWRKARKLLINQAAETPSWH